MRQPQRRLLTEMTERNLDALRNDASLARFVMQGRCTGRQLGTGSYGSVEEVARASTLSQTITAGGGRCFTVLSCTHLLCAG